MNGQPELLNRRDRGTTRVPYTVPQHLHGKKKRYSYINRLFTVFWLLMASIHSSTVLTSDSKRKHTWHGLNRGENIWCTRETQCIPLCLYHQSQIQYLYIYIYMMYFIQFVAQMEVYTQPNGSI